ncbi:hypothetical protein D187_005782 [Cystobacter fuscus DSM 2262]|uniref:Uncharacterized protein n=1 Tax=Cystobacter fuscus (strain ATCC 25194 / DSM 2262 / NBRC 100088 / M29) TaxID=1242864 RepID=S9PJY4_CYSF2|nr:hypothetical protein [Cystobacter fuscus]EPX63376.1 hypothetical protein D187_005782 [Cystobacter fuscus DSM 2262]
MANEKSEKDGGLGPFQLGRRCEEVEANLGRLYESRDTGTGQPALTLMPGEHVEWQPSGPWEVRILCQPTPPSVTIRPEQAPTGVPLTELADILALASASVQAVEDSPQVQSHLSAPPEHPAPLPPSPSRGMLAAAGLALLALGLGTGLFLARTHEHPPSPSPVELSDIRSEVKAPLLSDTAPPAPATLAYPLPKKPFKDQAIAPCKPELWEEEINKGCWIQLGRRPPCLDVHAEYQGKCYLPVSKDRGRPPQSARP